MSIAGGPYPRQIGAWAAEDAPGLAQDLRTRPSEAGPAVDVARDGTGVRRPAVSSPAVSGRMPAPPPVIGVVMTGFIEEPSKASRRCRMHGVR